jgi:hypothetical protein
VAVQEGTVVLLVCEGAVRLLFCATQRVPRTYAERHHPPRNYTGGGRALNLGLDARSDLINIWPASETMLPESIESHKGRENAAGSACLSQSNLLLPYL